MFDTKIDVSRVVRYDLRAKKAKPRRIHFQTSALPRPSPLTANVQRVAQKEGGLLFAFQHRSLYFEERFIFLRMRFEYYSSKCAK